MQHTGWGEDAFRLDDGLGDTRLRGQQKLPVAVGEIHTGKLL